MIVYQIKVEQQKGGVTVEAHEGGANVTPNEREIGDKILAKLQEFKKDYPQAQDLIGN